MEMKNRSIALILLGFLFLLGTVGAMESETIVMTRILAQLGIGLGAMLIGYLGLRRYEIQRVVHRYHRMKREVTLQIMEQNRPVIGFVK